MRTASLTLSPEAIGGYETEVLLSRPLTRAPRHPASPASKLASAETLPALLQIVAKGLVGAAALFAGRVLTTAPASARGK